MNRDVVIRQIRLTGEWQVFHVGTYENVFGFSKGFDTKQGAAYFARLNGYIVTNHNFDDNGVK